MKHNFSKELVQAIEDGDSDTALQLIKSGAGISSRPDGSANTPLTAAIDHKNTVLTEALLEAGADPDACDIAGSRPIIIAAFQGNIKILELLIRYRADVNIYGHWRETALFAAVKNNYPEAVRLLITAGADVNLPCCFLSRPVCMEAVENGSSEIVDILLKAGSDVNFTDVLHQNALRLAVMRKDLKIAEMLADAGADMNLAGIDGKTSLYTAAFMNSIPLLKLLISRGADPNISDSNGNTPLLGAIMYMLNDENSNDNIALLLRAGADPNMPGPNGDTPIICAAERSFARVMELLAEAGADPLKPGKNGKTAMDILADENYHKFTMFSNFLERKTSEKKLAAEDARVSAGTGFEFDI